MAKDPQLALKQFTDKLKKYVNRGASNKELKAVAEFAIGTIVKRTRLGYGAPTDMIGNRFRLKPLSETYVEYRSKSGRRKLGQYASPKRSNLTFSGKLLDSIGILSIKQGQVVVGPKGSRAGGLTNADVARFVAEQGRSFLNLTIPEFKQLVRFYRTRFADLRRRSGLT